MALWCSKVIWGIVNHATFFGLSPNCKLVHIVNTVVLIEDPTFDDGIQNMCITSKGENDGLIVLHVHEMEMVICKKSCDSCL